MDIAEGVLTGSRRALSRAITIVENETDEAAAIMQQLYPHTGSAQVIGITGPPGAGKSTLTNKLARHYRQAAKTVGIIAVDPTSPYSGGSILGDRIRMTEMSTDPGVFIRSMATRGSLGGLANKTAEVVKVLDAFGMDVIIVETVGVGQSEVDIVRAADTTLVILVPGMGDDIQAIKAGILEIGDIFVINKADHEGADKLNVELEMMLEMGMKGVAWRPPIVRTQASSGDGIDSLAEHIAAHADYLESSGELAVRRKLQAKNELLGMVHSRLSSYIMQHVTADGQLDGLIEAIRARRDNPYAAVERIVGMMLK